MSRRRGEFEHRTSIFEGAFRAWSHLGGLHPKDLEEKTVAELDPLTNPMENDSRLLVGSSSSSSSTSTSTSTSNRNRRTAMMPSSQSSSSAAANHTTYGTDSSANVSENAAAATAGSSTLEQPPQPHPQRQPFVENPIMDGSSSSHHHKRRGLVVYAYEPLPRSGVYHSYVQAILAPWLGPEADPEAIQLGLTTLRTWWQHRRKGESGSAVAALNTEKMKGVVEGYTRHFFAVAHCLIVHDKEQPPKTLHTRMKEYNKAKRKNNQLLLLLHSSSSNSSSATAAASSASAPTHTDPNQETLHAEKSPAAAPPEEEEEEEEEESPSLLMTLPPTQRSDFECESTECPSETPCTDADANTTNTTTAMDLSPLERLHAAQRLHQQQHPWEEENESSEGIVTTLDPPQHYHHPPATAAAAAMMNVIPLKGKCVPGKIDLPVLVDTVARQAAQLTHRGGGGMLSSLSPLSLSDGGGGGSGRNHHNAATLLWTKAASKYQSLSPLQFGDPDRTPVAFVSGTTVQIAMTLEGITCAHCVKIVETVLRGCNGSRSPIDGLLDAAADRLLSSVLILIDQPINARRIAFESARNLAMVGYTAKAYDMPLLTTTTLTTPTTAPATTATATATESDLERLTAAFTAVAASINDSSGDIFGWKRPCTCPDNGVVRDDCPRHSQMNESIFEAFHFRAVQVTNYMMSRHGMNPPSHDHHHSDQSRTELELMPAPISITRMDSLQEEPLHIDQPMNFNFDQHHPLPLEADPTTNHHLFSAALDVLNPTHHTDDDDDDDDAAGVNNDMVLDGTTGMGMAAMAATGQYPQPSHYNNNNNYYYYYQQQQQQQQQQPQRVPRNPSVFSHGSTRNMSITSDVTLGRALSQLSALSIDWENLDDFDVEVDFSANIHHNANHYYNTNNSNTNNNSNSNNHNASGGTGGGATVVRRRSSAARRSIKSTAESDNNHVSFKV